MSLIEENLASILVFTQSCVEVLRFSIDISPGCTIIGWAVQLEELYEQHTDAHGFETATLLEKVGEHLRQLWRRLISDGSLCTYAVVSCCPRFGLDDVHLSTQPTRANGVTSVRINRIIASAGLVEGVLPSRSGCFLKPF